MSCDEIRELAPDVALGIADGEERARVIDHLSGCGDCRRLVEELSDISDELLTLAPIEEPPEGFESRVIERFGLGRGRKRPLGGPLLRRLGPPIAAAAITAAALVAVYDDDRETASDYRETLERADGRYFQADRLLDPAGAESGTAFAYGGDPSWIFVTVDPAHRRKVMTAQLVTADGPLPLEGFRLSGNGSWGGAIPIDLERVASFRLLGKHPGDVLVATLRRYGSDD